MAVCSTTLNFHFFIPSLLFLENTAIQLQAAVFQQSCLFWFIPTPLLPLQPERLRGDEYGVHSDVWSLGISLVEVNFVANIFVQNFLIKCVVYKFACAGCNSVNSDTFQLEFVSIFSQIKVRTFINTYKVLKHVKILAMRAALKLSIQLKRTIS